ENLIALCATARQGATHVSAAPMRQARRSMRERLRRPIIVASPSPPTPPRRQLRLRRPDKEHDAPKRKARSRPAEVLHRFQTPHPATLCPDASYSSAGLQEPLLTLMSSARRAPANLHDPRYEHWPGGPHATLQRSLCAPRRGDGSRLAR